MATISRLGQPSLDLIYQEARAKIEQQNQRVDALDTKGIAVLTAASLIVTVAPAVRLAGLNLNPLQTILLGIAGAAYLVLLGAVLIAVGTRRFNFPPNPTILYQDYLAGDPAAAKLAIVETIAQAYGDNESQVSKKAQALRWSLFFLAVESLALTASLVSR